MTRNLKYKLTCAVLATACAIPTSFAQSAPTPTPVTSPAVDTVTEPLNAQDRDVLSATEQLASEASQVLEQWITTQAITEDRLFARLYYPIPKTEPRKWTTHYDSLADRDMVNPEDKALSRSPLLQYAIVTDLNGYVPAHNSRFAQALTGNMAQDYVNNRTKRILGDLASFAAARNEGRYLVQRTRLETGDLIYEISVPINVRGKHWGCARIGYRRAE